MTVAEVRLWGRMIGAVSVDGPGGVAAFEYTPEFRRSGIEVAPLQMLLADTVYTFPALPRGTFDSPPGMLDDAPHPVYSCDVDAKSLIAGAVIFGVGFGAGMLVTRGMAPLERDPFGSSVQQWEEAQNRAQLLKAGSHLRQVAYAIFAMHSNDPEWTLPPTEAALIEQLIEHDMLTHDMIDKWPSGMHRPAGEPPFYLVGIIDQVAAREPKAVLLVEHPVHHGDAGGSIVYADTTTEQVDEATLRRLLASGG